MTTSFINVVDAAPETLITSATAVLSGLTVGWKTVQIVGGVGQLSINGGAWGASGAGQNGSEIALRVTTPPGEVGDVTTVQVSVVSLGTLAWTVTNRDLFLREAGIGGDSFPSFRVGAMAPVSAAAATDEIFDDSYKLVAETGEGASEALATAHCSAMLTSHGAGRDALDVLLRELVEEAASSADTLLPRLSLILANTAVASDSATHVVVAQALVVERATGAARTLLGRATVLLSEAGAATSVLFGSTRARPGWVEEYGAATATSFPLTATALRVDEAVAATDLPIHSVAAMAGIIEGGTPREETIYARTDRLAYLFNARSAAHSAWQEVEVAEVFSMGNSLYGIAPDGIYLLANHAAQAHVYTGLVDFGSDKLKAVPYAYVSAASESPVSVSVNAVGQGGKVYNYSALPASVNTPTQTRVQLGRGLRSKHFGFVFGNTIDSPLTLADVDILVGDTSRRI